jgi:hypothetical protein
MDQPTLSDSRCLRRGWWAAAAAATVCIVVGETLRWSDPALRQQALAVWLCGEHSDWLPFATLLLMLPFCRPLGGRDSHIKAADARERVDHSRVGVRQWLLCVCVCGAALAMSHAVGQAFVDEHGDPLPPAYHDEYSYLFQAETFLAGRTSFPTFEPRPELFIQMHVLNEGRLASRYFPGVGLWMAPFVALGDPWLGHRVAAAIAAGLMFWIGRELSGDLVGCVAGLLMAVSPGLAIFSNLLLSHHPTLVGLLLFIWAFLFMKRTGNRGAALLAGLGLAYAMLCRPMTAAGVGLPFGIWFAWWLATGRGRRGASRVGEAPSPSSPQATRPRSVGSIAEERAGVRGPSDDSLTWAQFGLSRRLQFALLMSAPLLTAFAALYAYNRSITGDGLVSPYQLYTDVYTPRHVYGFNNVVRGEQRLGPKVLDNYDHWAENLTPALATRNVWRRLAWSLRWTLGVIPLLVGLVFFLVGRGLRGDWWFILAAIVSLHAVHVPYWFEGIMGWHYVLESAPLWLLLFAGATATLVRWSRALGNVRLRLWWSGLIAVAVLVNLVTIPLSESRDGSWLLWRARLDRAISEVRFPRVRYAAVRDRVDELRDGRPAVVLVLPDPADRSIDYVTNSPSLDASVLWARVPDRERSPAALRDISALFPERTPIVFDAHSMRLEPLPRGT